MNGQFVSLFLFVGSETVLAKILASPILYLQHLLIFNLSFPLGTRWLRVSSEQSTEKLLSSCVSSKENIRRYLWQAVCSKTNNLAYINYSLKSNFGTSLGVISLKRSTVGTFCSTLSTCKGCWIEKKNDRRWMLF